MCPRRENICVIIVSFCQQRVNKQNTSQKYPSSVLSPTENPNKLKKSNMMNDENNENATSTKRDELKEVIGPLIVEVTKPLLEEVKLLRESVDSKYSKLEDTITSQRHEVMEEIHKLEETLTMQKDAVAKDLLNKISQNQCSIGNILEKNKSLEKENPQLHERLDKIEMNQLGSNIIITGIPEQTWESYDHINQRVIDTVIASLGSNTSPELLEISCCTRVGHQ